MRVLFVGESWMKSVVDSKGADFSTSGYYEESGLRLREALAQQGLVVDYLPTHEAQWRFPESVSGLRGYDALFLSDIGSNTLLLHPDTMNKSVVRPNRLTVIRDWVNAGGGFAMIGGWMSFQGVQGKANYKDTAIEELLPVELLPYDDRREVPEGAVVEILRPEHPVLRGIDGTWPVFLGYNRLKAKREDAIVARCGKDVFIAAWEYGEGRSLAFASDCAPHWATEEFLGWRFYATFWANVTRWLAAAR